MRTQPGQQRTQGHQAQRGRCIGEIMEDVGYICTSILIPTFCLLIISERSCKKGFWAILSDQTFLLVTLGTVWEVTLVHLLILICLKFRIIFHVKIYSDAFNFLLKLSTLRYFLLKLSTLSHWSVCQRDSAKAIIQINVCC